MVVSGQWWKILYLYAILLACFLFEISDHINIIISTFWIWVTEATFEVLPRLNDIKFGSGVIDELLFLDLPREQRFASGVMMLEYAKAVQESVYEQLRVVREGHLRILFTQDLKVIKQSKNIFYLNLLCIMIY